MRRALCLFVGLAFGACGLPSADEFARETPDAGSSSSSSGAPSDAGLAPSDGGSESGPPLDGGSDAAIVNLAANPDFENGSCGGVNFFQGTGGITNDAHAGTHACQVCRENESTDYYTFNPFYVVLKPVNGATYHASAWVKQGADSFKDQTITISLRSANTDPTFQDLEETASPDAALTDQWQFIEVKLTLTKDSQEVDFFVGATTLTTAGQRCFTVDDVAVWRE